MGVVNVARSWVRPRAAILLYHRVSEASPDPQLLAVSRRNFGEQLDVIRQMSVPVPLADLRRPLRRHRSGKPSVVVTFDDGYVDNLYSAHPLLSCYEVPATVFVSSGFVKSQTELPHDELEKIFLQPGRLPPTLTLEIEGRTHRWDLGADAEYGLTAARPYRRWNVLSPETPTARHRIYRAVSELLMPLASDQRAQCLSALRDWAQIAPAARRSHRPLAEAEVVALHRKGLVAIGGHTVTHPVLAAQPDAVQRDEIACCRAELETMLHAPVESFAYPYGGPAHYSAASVAAVQEAGFTTACANRVGVVCRGADLWQLPRLVVRDWPGAVFRERLEAWLWR